MAIKDKSALTSTLNSNITDPLNKQNTAARVREIIQDTIDSLADITGSNTFNGDQVILGTLNQGFNTITSGSYSHAEGLSTISSGSHSHAEGFGNITYGEHSHAEGRSNQTIGRGSHAEGGGTTTVGEYSHAEGLSTISSGSYQHTSGQFNTQGDDTSLLIIGNGIDYANRSDAFKVRMSGSIILPVTSSNIPSWTGTQGEMIFGDDGSGNFVIWAYLGGQWRSGSLY
jgi:hypothetical protein